MREGKENQHMREKSEKENKREITGKRRGERRCFPTFSGEDYIDEQSREGKKVRCSYRLLHGNRK